MNKIDLQPSFDGFFDAARAYRDEPGIMTGLELDEKAGRVRQSCYTALKDEALGRGFERLLSALRRQDTALANRLLDELLQGLETHGIRPRTD